MGSSPVVRCSIDELNRLCETAQRGTDEELRECAPILIERMCLREEVGLTGYLNMWMERLDVTELTRFFRALQYPSGGSGMDVGDQLQELRGVLHQGALAFMRDLDADMHSKSGRKLLSMRLRSKLRLGLGLLQGASWQDITTLIDSGSGLDGQLLSHLLRSPLAAVLEHLGKLSSAMLRRSLVLQLRTKWLLDLSARCRPKDVLRIPAQQRRGGQAMGCVRAGEDVVRWTELDWADIEVRGRGRNPLLRPGGWGVPLEEGPLSKGPGCYLTALSLVHQPLARVPSLTFAALPPTPPPQRVLTTVSSAELHGFSLGIIHPNHLFHTLVHSPSAETRRALTMARLRPAFEAGVTRELEAAALQSAHTSEWDEYVAGPGAMGGSIAAGGGGEADDSETEAHGRSPGQLSIFQQLQKASAAQATSASAVPSAAAATSFGGAPGWEFARPMLASLEHLPPPTAAPDEVLDFLSAELVSSHVRPLVEEQLTSIWGSGTVWTLVRSSLLALPFSECMLVCKALTERAVVAEVLRQHADLGAESISKHAVCTMVVRLLAASSPQRPLEATLTPTTVRSESAEALAVERASRVFDACDPARTGQLNATQLRLALRQLALHERLLQVFSLNGGLCDSDLLKFGVALAKRTDNIELYIAIVRNRHVVFCEGWPWDDLERALRHLGSWYARGRLIERSREAD